jgi:predicted DsbA family dithiol-disulfide isomerase
MNKPLINIEVVSDVVCPWCYIGKRRLERAIGQLKDEFNFSVVFSPFELNPDIPQEGINQREYLTGKFGNAERYDEITRHVTEVASKEGLRFDFGKQYVSPNTRNAHRILWHARKAGRQPALKEALMKAYFEEGIDLSRKENLVRIAVNEDLSSEKVSALLDSAEGLHEVEALEKLNYQRGISAVPFFIINDKYGISGAQPTEVFVKVLSEIGAKM